MSRLTLYPFSVPYQASLHCVPCRKYVIRFGLHLQSLIIIYVPSRPQELNQSGIQYQLWLTRSSCVLSHGRFWMRRWRLDSSSENKRIQGMLQISDIFQLVANITMPDPRRSLGVSYLRIFHQAPRGLFISSAFEG